MNWGDLMDGKALYLLAEFDSETQEALAECYKALKEQGFNGTQTKDIPYHFTMGTFSCDREQELAQDAARICAETQAIDIRLDHLGLFGLHVLFAEPNMNTELLALVKCFSPDTGKGCHLWAAHATLLIDEPENILGALPIAAKAFRPTHAQITRIGLYEFFPLRPIGAWDLLPVR